MAESILLRVRLAAARTPLPSGSHPVVMVTELVQKDVQELVGPNHAVRELAKVGVPSTFTRYAQAREYLLVILVIRRVNDTPRILGPRTEADDAKIVPALGTTAGTRGQDGVETPLQLPPVPGQLDESEDVLLSQKMTMPPPRPPP